MAVAVLIALAAAPAPARAATKPTNGSIAFSGKRAGSLAIYTRESNCTRLRVIPTAGRSSYPVFSPRGRRVAMTRYGSFGAQVWLQYTDGTGQRPLTTGPADTMPSWSPDATTIAFARGPKGGRDLYRVSADGTGLVRLTLSRSNDEAPDWSVKSQIAFVRRNAKSSDIYSVDQAGGAPKRLTRSPEDDLAPAWSPTGRTLVYSKGRAGRRDLYTLTADGRHARQLTAVKGDEGEPSFSPDGTRVAFTHTYRHKRRVFIAKVRGGPVRSLPSRSRRVRRLTTSGSAPNLPSWQPASLDPVIAAAGDIACDPSSPFFNAGQGVPGKCRQKLTSDQLLRMDLSAVLMVGDSQYEHGAASGYQQSFDPSWGRVKSLIRPVPGNHEYEDPGAAGYYDYFNGPGVRTGPAGDRQQGGYYSYDVGSWHVVGLNSECGQIPGGCGPDSPQVQWLRADLAAHPTRCTLAYFHGPRFTSGRYGEESGDVKPFWDALYAAGADVVVSGHEHFYERFAPQTPAGVPDPARGLRQFTVGVGGKGGHQFVSQAPNSEARDNRVLGAVALTLGEGRYDWRLVRAPNGATTDSGSGACH
ncbi:MAG: metallophosphoesterase [Thermoleophilaceae bacterium]